MWWPIVFLADAIRDYILFVLIDSVAKSLLKEASSDSEKRLIWLYESLVLAATCLIIYLLDRTPYFCLFLTIATLVYAQLLGRVDFGYWWTYMFERWEEHQHHTENVQLINEKQKQIEILRKIRMPTPVSKPVLTRLSNFLRRSDRGKDDQPTTPVFSMNRMYVPMYPIPNTLKIPQKTAPTSMQRPDIELEQRQPYKVTRHVPTYTQPEMVETKNHMFTSTESMGDAGTPITRQTNKWFFKNELKRRPLRTHEAREINQYSFTNVTSSVRGKFLSAFGLSGKKEVSSGLRNEGLNLCFMNSILQCLSHTPALVDKLYDELDLELDCSEVESNMISALTDILSQCRNNKCKAVLDPTVFRQAVSALNGGLVAPCSRRQMQQDAAEFFMWLVETVHNAANKRQTSGMAIEKGSDLETLKFIYGDLSTARLKTLLNACKNEIGGANGLDNESYAEPIQRLSDIEWLIHKRENHSAVDSVFSGQLIEAYHCLNDNHITVNTQTFNILPVPIAPARTVSGLVHLEDCFTKFCHIEHLAGMEGFQCSHCLEGRSTQNSEHSVKQSGKGRLGSTQGKTSTSSESAFGSTILSPASCMSPIPRTDRFNDSGFHDNAVRTSTPVNSDSARFMFPSCSVSDTERRCLLRHLPECLVIQLMRFSFNKNTQQSQKLCSAMKIPLKGLDLTAIMFDNVTNRREASEGEKSLRYDLYGICVHLGAECTNQGHYVSYCQDESGVWRKFDDEIVSEVNIEYEMTTREIRDNAYLLFYKKCKQ